MNRRTREGAAFAPLLVSILIMLSFPDTRPAARLRHVLALGAALTVLFSCNIAAAQELTLSDILSRAAAYDPTVPANAARIQAAEAGVRQAGIGPQPILGAELEDFAGTGRYSPVDRSQATLYYERTLERGGKRQARTDAALSDLTLTQQRGRLRSLDLLAEVQTAWVEALAAQSVVAVAKERLAAAERLEKEVSRRAKRALDPLFAGERARTAAAQARIAHDQALETARIARTTLAAWWGGSADFVLDSSSFTRLGTKSPVIEDTPDLALLAAARDAANARIRLEQARSVADPTIRVGVRHFGEGSEVALVVGGSIPLGGGQANRGNFDRAKAELLAAEAEIEVERLMRQHEVERLTAARRAIAAEISRIDAEVLPTAEHAVVLVRDGFNRGGLAFTFLEVAEAQRSLIDARTRRVDLLRRFHLDGVRLDRISGSHISLISRAEDR